MSYVLKKGGREIGPLDAENIIALLQAGDCLPSDELRPETDPEGWASVSAFFPDGSWTRHDIELTLIGSSNPLAVTLRQLLNHEQDEGVARQLVSALADRLERGELVKAVAVQKGLVLTLAPMAVIATTERILIVRDYVVGKNVEALAYAEVAHARTEPQIRGATLQLETQDRRKWAIDSLPKDSAEQVLRWILARQEQLRPIPPPLPAAQEDDPLAQLKKFKALLDQGLITAADYEAKKREILPQL